VFDAIYGENYHISMKKLIFQKFLKDVFKSFIIISFSISLIVWTIQAVNFLDFVTVDGHSLSIYFSYTVYNFPKIIHRILPFAFFISLFFTISQYEINNELILYWNNGINKIQFINVVIVYSVLIFIFQTILGAYISPASQDKSRSFLRSSNVDFFPSLIKPGKFIDTVSNLTIFIESKNKSGFYKNIFLHDAEQYNTKLGLISSQTIHAKSGILINNNGNRYFELYNGQITDIQKKNIRNVSFETIQFDLTKYSSQSITYPKIQEAPSRDLFNCLHQVYKKEIDNFTAKFLRCEKDTLKNVKEEFIKRFFKPLYLIFIGLMSSLLVITSKESKNYNYFRLALFITIFFVIIISEVSLRYSASNDSLMIALSSLPLIFFLTVYIPLITKFHNKI